MPTTEITTSIPLAKRGEDCRHHRIALVRMEGLEQVFLARFTSCQEGTVLRTDGPADATPLFDDAFTGHAPETTVELLEEALWTV